MLTHKKQFETIDEYIKTFPNNVQVILEKLRRAIRKAAPGAEEAISYQIPSFKLRGKYLIYFAGWKHHIAMYPVPPGDKAFKKEVSPYQTGKGTLRFPLDKPLPLRLIKKIVDHRVKQDLDREKGKTKRRQ